MVIDFIRRLSERTAISPLCLVGWMELSRSKYYQWKDRYGKANEHNGLIPRDHWLEQWEKEPSSISITSSPWRATADSPS